MNSPFDELFIHRIDGLRDEDVLVEERKAELVVVKELDYSDLQVLRVVQQLALPTHNLKSESMFVVSIRGVYFEILKFIYFEIFKNMSY